MGRESPRDGEVVKSRDDVLSAGPDLAAGGVALPDDERGAGVDDDLVIGRVPVSSTADRISALARPKVRCPSSRRMPSGTGSVSSSHHTVSGPSG
jgi:hypothetical protein